MFLLEMELGKYRYLYLMRYFYFNRKKGMFFFLDRYLYGKD